MPLIMPKAAFIHVPRNAGSWVRQRLLRLKSCKGKVYRIPHENYRHHTPVSWLADNHPEIYHQQFVWTSVRSPLAFLRTFWFKKIMESVTPVPVGYKRFDQDIDRVVTDDPGCVTRYYKYYLTMHWQFPAIDGYVRAEYVAKELIAILERMGVGVTRRERQSIMHSKIFQPNMTPKQRSQLTMSLELKQRVLDAEEEFMDTFKYQRGALIKLF